MKILITEEQLKKIFLFKENVEVDDNKLKSVVFNLLDIVLNNSVIKEVSKQNIHHNIGEILIVRDNYTLITKLPNNKIVINYRFLSQTLMGVIPIEENMMFDFVSKWTKEIINNKTESNKISDAIKKRDGLTV
jgi:hypothetical protein